MTPKPVSRWGLLNRKKNRLDGETAHLIFADCLPVLFRTRREARTYAEKRYGYIRQRPDLLAEPHCDRVPQAVRVTIAIVDAGSAGARKRSPLRSSGSAGRSGSEGIAQTEVPND